MDDRKGLVIDPYCGSGTTLVAAKLLGHNYIGIDVSKVYIEYSEKRLVNALNEKAIADIELSKHIVINSFKERKAKGAFTGRFKPNSKDLESKILKLF